MPDKEQSTHDARGESLLDGAVARFEAAWIQGKRPAIQDFLPSDANPPASTEASPLLWELIHAEIEFRLKAGEAARVEEYLAQYPQLAGNHTRLAALVRAEYDLARRLKPAVDLADYQKRFPDLAAELQTQLNEPATRRGRSHFRLNCPHCQNPIEIVAEDTAEELVCPSCGSNFHLDQERTVSWSPGHLPKLGKFELLEVVGRGAFGTVYRAKDTQLDRIVAIKLPRSGTLGTEVDEDRFIRDARSTAQLRHPGIVPVYEVGRSETFPYIVMEFVEGSTLADVLTARRLTFRESAELLMQVAEALEHAHQQGVIHRDLKPSNIMLSPEGTPRLMDFGLAKRDAGEITMTMDGQILGTPAYMSPEQAAGEAHNADARSDVYSLGVILYQLLTGELPFRGNMRMLVQQVLHDEPRAPRKVNDRVPRDLETICLKAMSKEATRRYATAQSLAEDLGRYLRGEVIHASRAGYLERGWRWLKRRRESAVKEVGLIAGGAILAACMFVMLTRLLQTPKRIPNSSDDNPLVLNELQKAEIRPTRLLSATPQVNDSNSENVPQLKLVEPNKFEPLTFVVQGTPLLPKELWATLEFDEKRLAVANQEGRTLRPNVRFDAGSTGEASAEFALKVKALDVTRPPTKLSVRFEGGELKHESSVEVLAPKPTRLELVIKGDSAKTWELPDATRSPTVVHGALRPFPNVWVDGKPKGGTNYRIWVHNSAKRKRDLKYRLVALPCEKGDLPRTAEFPWIGEPRLPSGIQTIVPEEDLSLPPEGEIPLPFAPTPKANTPPSVPAAPEGENTPPPEPGMPIEGGLIAIFRDPANSTEEWIWLEVDVLHPDEYLSEPKVIYDGETERIDVSVSPQDAADLPAEGTEITLQVPPSVTGKKVLRGVLQPERPDRIPPLYANVPAQRDLKLRIALDVDGYPRAFIYDVICSGGRGVVPRQVRNFYELQFMKPDDQELFPAIPKLPVQLLVDFPPRDEVESAYACRLLINETQTAEFFHDRRRRVWLLKPQVPGEITLQTAVDDLQVEVRTVEFKNDEVTITSELWFANLDGTSADRIERAQRTVRIDAVNPDIRASDDGRLEFRGEQEQVLLVRFRVIDTNPIKKVQVAFGQIDGVLQGPVEATQVGTDEYQALMPTVGKSAGTYQLHAQATDAAGNVCSPVRMTAYITARASPKSDTKTNDLSGTVVIGGQAARGIQMSLVGPISATTASGENGSYKFTEVPAGAYKLSAKGNFKNAQYSGGPIDVLISPPPAPPTELGPIALTK